MRKLETEIVEKDPNAALFSHVYDVSTKFWWHHHAECEFVLVLSGGGVRYIGDSMHRYQKNDLVFHGAGLPHAWSADPPRRSKGPGPKNLVVQFREDFLGKEFLTRTETKPIADLLKRSARGLLLKGSLRSRVATILMDIERSAGLPRLMLLLRAMNEMAQSDSMSPICSIPYKPDASTDNLRLVEQVCNYLTEEYTKTVRLSEVAGRFHMAPSTFTRFLKRNTGKTLVDFLTALRVNEACRLLSTTDMTIAEVAYASGFNDPSYFDRKFREMEGMLPREFRHRPDTASP